MKRSTTLSFLALTGIFFTLTGCNFQPDEKIDDGSDGTNNGGDANVGDQSVNYYGDEGLCQVTASVDSLFFAEIEPGLSQTLPVSFQNYCTADGAPTLTLVVSTTGASEFSTSTSSLELTPGSTRVVLVTFAPAVEGNFVGTLLLDSAELDREIGLLGSAAYPEDTGGYSCWDSDGDGHDDVDCGGDDCDDGDASVFPGAPDVSYNGIDEDCSGMDNLDADGDGYDSSDYGGSDCNDADPAINPGATEIPDNGIDEDCDGSDSVSTVTDVDGDGHDDTTFGGDDCDDSDATVHPGAAEIPYDGVDQDCDGADWTDVDGDGYDSDVVTGGDDCDDDDAGINPDAVDILDNGIDENCSGADNHASQWTFSVDVTATSGGVGAIANLDGTNVVVNAGNTTWVQDVSTYGPTWCLALSGDYSYTLVEGISVVDDPSGTFCNVSTGHDYYAIATGEVTDSDEGGGF